MILRRPGRWAALWALAVLVLTLMPASDVPRIGWAERLAVDKLVHAFLFGVQVILLALAFSGRPAWRRRAHPYLLALLAAVAFGALVEILQELMGLGRHADVLDLLADAAGAVAGLTFLHWRGAGAAR